MNSQRQRNIQNIVNQIAIDSRTKTMRSDHATHLELVQDAEQNHLPQHQVAAINEAARQRKRDINAQFWHSIKSVVFVISCAAIAVYTLIHFAG